MWYSARSWLTTCPNRGSSTLSSNSAMDSPIVMPPTNCERAVRGLMIRPAAKTPSSRGTRISPVSTFTRASTNCAPKADIWYLSRYGFGPTEPSASSPSEASKPCSAPEGPGGLDDRRAPGGRPRRAAGHRGHGVGGVADQDVDVVDGHVEGVGGDLRERPSRRRCRCRRRRSRPCSGRRRTGSGRWTAPAGRWGRSTTRPRCRSASRSCLRTPGRGSRRTTRTARAPRRRHSTRCLLENGFPLSGSTWASLRIRSSTGSMPSASASSSKATSGPNIPGHSPGRPHPRRHGYVEGGEPVGRPPVRRGVHRPGRDAGLLGELLDLRGLLDDVDADAAQAPVRVRGQPHPLDGRGPVAGEGEHLLPGERELDRPAGQGASGHRGDDDVGVRRPLRPEPASDVRGDHAHLLVLQAEASTRRWRGPSARPGWSPTA